MATAEKFYTARIVSRTEISNDLWKVRIDPGGPFNYVAGQYATLGVQADTRLIERAYSIVSSPYEDQLEIFIELVPAGELTPLLYQLQSGATLAMRKIAKGRFTVDLASGHKQHLLLSTVTGVAPFMSYLRSFYRDWKEKKFTGDHTFYLINGASRSWEFGYNDELMAIAADVPWLKYCPTISRIWEDPKWGGEVGRVEDLIRKYSDLWGLDNADCTGYLCGHPQMIESGLGILKRRGFPNASLRQEVYWVPPKPAA